MHSDNYAQDEHGKHSVTPDIKMMHNAVRCGIMKLTEAECLEVLRELRERGIL